MHNLHFILIDADSAEGAASEADSLILHWGDENNWRRIGGVASEDGSDNIENHDNGRWGLSSLDDVGATPKDGFTRGVAFLHRRIADPVILPDTPGTTHPDLNSAFRGVSERLRDFDPRTGGTFDLWCVRRCLKHLSELLNSRRAREDGEEIPQFYAWQFDHFGLTDLTEHSDGARRYLVFLDMHS